MLGTHIANGQACLVRSQEEQRILTAGTLLLGRSHEVGLKGTTLTPWVFSPSVCSTTFLGLFSPYSSVFFLSNNSATQNDATSKMIGHCLARV